MGKTVALEGRTLEWVRRRFQRYYRATTIEPPSRFARREFAAFPFAEQTLMRRHASFATADEFHGFLSRESPRHVYYSSAYYRAPDHPTMASKEWLGADLIFDLDADHLRGAEALAYPAQLDLVKSRTARLFDDFLVGDFGIDPSKMQLVFSGGRGYHIHVTDESYWPLSSPERRELVEYIQGTCVEASAAVVDAPPPSTADAPADGAPTRRRGSARGFRALAPPDAGGWRGRTTRSLLELLGRWERDGVDAARADLVAMGLTPSQARKLASSLVTDGRGRQIRETLALDVFPKEVPSGLLDAVLQRTTIEVQGETDAPVTTDVHRLIRLPGSLHGGTGFRVVPLRREQLDSFDPWRDAIPPTSNGGSVTVELTEAAAYPFGDRAVEAAAGDRITVAEGAAAFLLLRGEAALPPSPG